MTRRLLPLLASLFVVLAVLSCRHRKAEPIAPVDPEVTPPAIATDVKGLLIRLSHADPAAAERAPAKRAETTPLSAADTATVLARLPELAAQEGDVQEFALRQASKPPPRTGATVLASFPPPPQDPGARPRPKDPLKVARFAPEGAVPIAPHLSVTFNHPMVPVTSLDVLAAKDVPVRLSPTPAGGQWRWVGTRTLMYEPTERFPMATRYEVSVPKGTRSALGTALAKAESWSFTTPTPTMELGYPNDQPVVRQPVMFVRFDQRIEPAAVLPTIHVKAGRKGEHALRLARPEEVEADPTVGQLATQSEDGRWLAFVPVAPLPADVPVTVTVGPGTPSAEGPLTTEHEQGFSFRTYGPMQITEHRCGWDGECPPGAAFEIAFSNPIDLETFDRSMVTAEPAIPNLRTEAYGEYLYVSGSTKGRTTYDLTISGELRDQFGQRLGKAQSLRFKVTKAPRSLTMQGSGLTVLDPAAKGRVSVFSVNHKKLRVRMWSVEPGQWAAWLEATQRAGEDPRDLEPPGKKVYDEVVKIGREDDSMVETTLDLAPALGKGGHGHVIVVVEQTDVPKEPWMLERAMAWVQVTDLAVQAHVDAERMLVWGTRLSDGAPVEGAEVELRAVGLRGRTDARGLASLALAKKGGQVVVLRKGDDVAFLPQSIWWWDEGGGWQAYDTPTNLRWYVFDDRGLYRPGEEVKLKGWLRSVDDGLGGDVGGLGGKVRQVSYRLSDSQGNELSKGTLALNAFGAFDTTLKLPDTMNLGQASLELSALPRGAMPAGESWHAIRVEEFRRPEYEVSTRVSEGPHVVGGHAVATVKAAYFAGGGLANAEVAWQVTSSPGWYQPPGHDRFSFGVQTPWWMFWRWWGPPDPAEQPRTVEMSALTDAAGEHHLRMDFVSVDPPRAMSVTAEALVTDVNRQAWASSTSLVVHPSTLYVGLRSDRQFVQAGEDLELDAIVSDIDGELRSGVPIRVRVVRVEQRQDHGEWVEEELDEQLCERDSGTEPVRCTLTMKQGGSHRIEAEVVDAKGRLNRTVLTTWVAGGELPTEAGTTHEQVLLIPDREQYEAGQTARISVSAPWAPAEALITINRSGVVEERTIHLDTSSTTVEVPIEEAMTPSVTVQVDVVGSAPRRGEDGKVDPELPRQPGYATGTATLQVPPLRRTLSIDVKPAQAKLEPGGHTQVELTVRDAEGRPVEDAEVALVVVDEAVLALTGYSIPDPIAAFYGWRDAGAYGHYLRDYVLLARPAALEVQGGLVGYGRGGGGAPGAKAAERSEGMDFEQALAPPSPPPEAEPMADEAHNVEKKPSSGASAGKPAAPIALRSDFSALAHFSPSVRTDAQGRASVPLTVPDNLTRYRITAVAVHGDRHFGKAESTVTARLPLMVRPSPPRFLNFGDEVELPVVVHNQTESAMTVDVAMRATGVELGAGAGQRVRVPAGDRVEVRFPARAEHAGTARFQVGAAASTWADAASFELPVWTPATTEAFATYGEIDAGGIVQPVAAPPEVFPQFGGLEITTSSTALQALTDAVLYLTSYPFECSEQVASRVLAVAALRDVLDAFEAEGLPSPKALVAAVDRDLERLKRMQGDDGGFSFWGRAYPSWPYLTVHVAHALERARAKGFTVPKDTRSRALAYLRDIESRFDPRTPVEVRRVIRAYALYVLRLAGEPKVRKAKALVDEAGLEELPLEALAWVLPTLHDEADTRALAAKIERHLGNRVAETAGAAHFVTHYDDGEHLLLHSDRRVDALALEALTITEPSSDLIPKLVRGLLAHRTAGRWSSTQENAFVLVALDRYFAEFEKATPSFVAKAWLGSSFAGQHAFRGRSTERHHVDVPMAWLADHPGEQDLVLTKEGKGRLYYRVGMRYAPRDLKLPPRDAGFVVERAYEAVDDDDDVSRDPDGTWRIKAGARVRVRVKMVTETRRYHVALVDPLPAGLEPLNPALATTGALPADPSEESGGPWWWWLRPWYEHQNLRDDRAEAFTSLLWAGVHDYDYIARATTPGRFVVPPPRAEEMYHPETFGRGSGDRVIVE
ncbi:MAG: hypothetical protein KC501_36060 [Myxococcales bacterium]|nr:hypothetical protein [Myxococcales bacterium]